ncbi:hypothetical protein Cfor_01117, partial [Coptotermes formosanus]
MDELQNKYNGWTKIFTDGSMNGDGLGAAFYTNHGQTTGLFKIENNVSIMTVELFAIAEALAHAIEASYNKIVILTDSKSSLLHLARCTSGFRGIPIAYTVLRHIYSLHQKGKKCKLQWIPSHTELSGNEEADRLAKLAVLNGIE